MNSIEDKLKQLNIIYGRIPSLKCIPNCHECCGPNFWLPIEAINIRKYLEEHGIKERFTKSLEEKCPYIENGKCIIYPVRPLVCRLFGVVKNELECPFTKPEKWLSEEEANKIFKEVCELSKGVLSSLQKAKGIATGVLLGENSPQGIRSSFSRRSLPRTQGALAPEVSPPCSPKPCGEEGC